MLSIGPTTLATLAFLASSLFSCGLAAAGPAEDIRPGTIVPAVTAQAEPAQTYALYLPSSYDPRKRWPVLYAFDPLARGSLPVECFRDAAEKYGYIVVGSNNSRNGPVEPALRAGLAMIIDTDARFPVDPSRLYATGFSGGARVACTMAQSLTVRMAGVIGCGAGFPAEAGPSAKTPFAFCGTVGNHDYNWTEMNELDRKLTSLGLPHRTLRFEGRHSWPPKEVALAAIEWLELQAMASGTRPRDPNLIARLLEKELAQARAEEASGALREAWSTYATAASTFKGLADVTELESKAATLREKKEVSDRLKREREEEEVEVRRMREVGALVEGLSDPDERFVRTAALRALIASLRSDERDARTPARRDLARRLLEQVNITAYYAGQPLLDAKEYSAAIAYLDLQAEVHPESASLPYRIATLHARSGNKKKALAALKAAAAKGFSDAARIEREEAFSPLREDARFRQLLDEIRKKQPAS